MGDRPSALVDTRVIYCGDNLEQLRKLPAACIDLVYIDPPFNSNRNYEVFWGESREKRAFEDRHASTQAYIEFMRPRCTELHRVLKPAGSFYYHCDWHASHYVKVMLDQIFGENVFQNEVVWKRADAHSDAKQGAQHYGRVHDSIFFYTKSNVYTFTVQYNPLPASTVEKWYRYIEEGTGRRYNKADVTGPGGEAKGCPVYDWKGVTRAWRYSKENMERLEREGRLVYTKSGMVYQKRYLDESKGVPLQSWWDDIGMLRGINKGPERLGYPTQKPLALLERIIKASSNENDIVLDAFCGCGTALVAAEQLGRQWIGIDISPTACRVMAKRMRDACGLREDERLWKVGRGFVVRDLPWTEAQLRKIPPFEFENWAVIALGGIPNKTQVGDMGIDGRIYPVSAVSKPAVRTGSASAPSPRPSPAMGGEGDPQPSAATGSGNRPPSPPAGEGRGEGGRKPHPELSFMDDWYPVQVKQKDRVGRPDIDAFEAMLAREERKKGFFVAFDYTQDALTEVDRFFRQTSTVIVALTVNEILEERIARKLA